MQENTVKQSAGILSLVLNALFFFLLILVVYYSWQLVDLQRETIIKLNKANKLMAKLETRFAAGEAAQIERSTRASLARRDSGAGTFLDLASLKEGLYSVRAPLVVGSGGGRKLSKQHSIYHFKMTIGPKKSPTAFHFGIAFSGVLSRPKMYVDYDSDGQVDVEMMHELVQWLPMHKLFSKSIRPDLAQATYDAFLSNFETASYSDVSGVMNHSDSVVRNFWSALEEQSDTIADLVAEYSANKVDEGLEFIENGTRGLVPSASGSLSLADIEADLRRSVDGVLEDLR